MIKAQWNYKWLHCWVQTTVCGALCTLECVLFFVGSWGSEAKLGHVRGQLTEIGSLLSILWFSIHVLIHIQAHTDKYTGAQDWTDQGCRLTQSSWAEAPAPHGLCCVLPVPCVTSYGWGIIWNIGPAKTWQVARWYLPSSFPAGGKHAWGLPFFPCRGRHMQTGPRQLLHGDPITSMCWEGWMQIYAAGTYPLRLLASCPPRGCGECYVVVKTNKTADTCWDSYSFNLSFPKPAEICLAEPWRAQNGFLSMGPTGQYLHNTGKDPLWFDLWIWPNSCHRMVPYKV